MRELLNKAEVKSFIDRIGERLGCDFTYAPSFPKGNEDICLVTRAVENGHSYGYSVVYLVWKINGTLRYREIENTKSSKDNLYYKNLRIENNTLRFTLEKSGTYSGNPSSSEKSIDLSSL